MTIEQLSRLELGPRRLLAYEGWDESVHDFSLDELLAVKTAVAAGRPLLVRGEPGTGKTQLARAAAASLGRHFLSQALDAHTEARDLFWTLDAVRRLSEAQLLAVTLAPRPGLNLRSKGSDTTARAEVDDRALSDQRLLLAEHLAEARFVEPGILWWAFDWEDAADQQVRCRGGVRRERAPWVDKLDHAPGAVVLLDEIDKADPVLPNALLEALGAGRFDGPLGCAPVTTTKPEPLVMITTNEERELPLAFLRRCAVLTLSLPDKDADLRTLLMDRGAQHGELYKTPPTERVLARSADLLVEDRKRYQEKGLPRPGQAEFLDLLRAVCRLDDDEKERLRLLEQLKPFVLKKHGHLDTPPNEP